MNNLYQVNFYRIFPDCTTTDEDALVAIVQADSWDNAVAKVERKYKSEFESARVFAVNLTERVEIIV